MELTRKYYDKYDPIHLGMIDSGNAIRIKINWPSLGFSDLAMANSFAKRLSEAVKFADKIEAEIKKKYPDVKVIK